MKTKEIDFTNGTITKKLIAFVIPIFISQLVQQAYNSVDIIFVGNMLGKQYSAAIGASSLLVILAIGLFTGLSTGMGVLFARVYGANDFKGRKKLAKLVIIVSFLVGAILTIVGFFLSKPALVLLNTPDDIMEIALKYIYIYFLSIIPMMLFNMTSGMLRALGNSTKPMIFQMVSGILNIFLDWIFILTFPNAIEGVAFATVISQSVAAVITYTYFIKGEKKSYALSNEKEEKEILLGNNLSIVKQIFAIGLPIGFQNMLVSLSNLFIQANINKLGIDSIAAFTDYFKIELFMYYPIISFGQAALYIVSQNVGAKKYDRIDGIVKTCNKIAIPIIIGIEIAIIIFAPALFRIFSKETEVILLGTKLIRTTAPFYFIYVFIEVFSNAIRSFGKSKTAMLVSLFNFAGLRALLLFIFGSINILNIQTVGIIYPITWTTSAITFYIVWKNTKNFYKNSKTV